MIDLVERHDVAVDAQRDRRGVAEPAREFGGDDALLVFEGSRVDNNRDMYEKGRGRPGAAQAAQTHCKRGHPLSGANLRISRGRRVCRTCAREWIRQKRASG